MEHRPFAAVGWMLTLLGVILVALPCLARLAPGVERLHWYLVYIYFGDMLRTRSTPMSPPGC